jgi:hypothetical protein
MDRSAGRIGIRRLLIPGQILLDEASANVTPGINLLRSVPQEDASSSLGPDHSRTMASAINGFSIR